MDPFVSHLRARQASPGPPMPTTPENDLENHTAEILTIVGFLYGIALVSVLLRVWVRIRILKAFGLDDWLMAIAMFLSTACLGCIIYLTRCGLGKNVEILLYHPDWMLPMFACLYFFSIFVVFAYSFIKLSIAVFLLRLAQRTKYTIVLQCILVFLVLFTIGSTFAIIFQCKPVAAGYDLMLRAPFGKGTCYSPDIFKKVGVFNSSVNIATDLLFAILPIPMVWNLQVNMRTKIGLISILSLGLFASATAIYKTPLQYHFFEEPDFTGHGAWYYVWQIVEMNVGIVAACLPTFKSLFVTFFEKVRVITNNKLGSSGRRSGHLHEQSGYRKQHDPSSLSLNNIKGVKGYNAHVVSVHEDRSDFEVGEEGYVHWSSRRQGASHDSDEVPLHFGEADRRGIVKTREVRVS